MAESEDAGHVTTGISLPVHLLEAVDAARGNLPRSTWFAEAAQTRLEEDHLFRKTFEGLSKRVEALELARGKDDAKEGSA